MRRSVGGAAAVVAAATLFAAGCGDPQPAGRVSRSAQTTSLDGLPAEPDYGSDISAHGDGIFYFDNMRELVANSDVIAVADVVEERAGRLQQEGKGEVAEEHNWRERYIVIAIDEVLWASRAAKRAGIPARLQLGDGAWEGGKPVWFNGVHWARPGERAIFFLRRERECGKYVYVDHSDVGRFLFEGDSIYGFERNALDYPLARELSELSVTELRARIATATADVDPKLREPDPKYNCR